MSSFENNQYGPAFENFPSIGGLMVSKMVVDEQIKPRFMYREKRTRPEDSGWRIFTGFETEEYNDNPDNTGIYQPSSILQIDPSIQDILLKGIGSIYEKTADGTEWYRVTDFDLEDDFITTHRLTEAWTIDINNLFERTVEDNGDLLYTTGDKSVRLTIWEEKNKNREAIYTEYTDVIENRDQSHAETLQKYDFSDDTISRIGYLIKEADVHKNYNVLYGFSIIDNETIQVALYFDEDEEINWAIETWKNIQIRK
jgi:hypothetical protein